MAQEFGVAGTPNVKVLSVQGVAGGTAMPISGTVTASPPTLVYSSSLATVGVASAVLAAAASRKALAIKNMDPAGIVYFSFTNPATTADIALQPGEGWLFNPGPSNALYAIGSQASIPVAIVSGV